MFESDDFVILSLPRLPTLLR